MTLMMIWNGYRYGKAYTARRLCNQQKDSDTDEGRIPPAPGHSHSLQNVEGWGTEHPIRTVQATEQRKEKGSLQKKDAKKKKQRMTMGRVHL